MAAPLWQAAALAGALAAVCAARAVGLTARARRGLQPALSRLALAGVASVLRVQKYRKPWLDNFLYGMALAVSIEFYTAFLPMLFWMNQLKLAAKLTILMALCIYVGNGLKDVVCAPRPASPPVWRSGHSSNAKEYGFPSTHSINVVALSAYLVQFCVNEEVFGNRSWCLWVMVAVLGLVSGIVVFGRLYLGMHTLVDIGGGVAMGVLLPLLFSMVDEPLVEFIIRGENVEGFQLCLALLLLFTYPTPESSTPSFGDATAFNGVVLGVTVGLHRSYGIYLHDGPTALLPLSLAGLSQLLKRMLLGFPIVLAAKAVGKAVALRMLPRLATMTGFPIKSTGYVKFLMDTPVAPKGELLPSKPAPEKTTDLPDYSGEMELNSEKPHTEAASLLGSENVPSGLLAATHLSFRGLRKMPAMPGPSDDALKEYLSVEKMEHVNSSRSDGWLSGRRISLGFGEDEPYDVDMGIRLVAYASLGWAVLELAPATFLWLGL